MSRPSRATRIATRVANAANDPAGRAAPTAHNAARTLAMTAGVPVPAPAPINTPNHVADTRKRATAQTPRDASSGSRVAFARYGLHAHMARYVGSDARPNAASSGDVLAFDTHMARTYGPDYTSADVMAASGYADLDALIAAARGADGSSTDPIGDLAAGIRAMRGDDAPRVQWQTGRWLAGIAAAAIVARGYADGVIPTGVIDSARPVA
jgi:hypothetical protein